MGQATINDSRTPAGTRSAAAFWRYWTGSTISRAGDAVTAVALPLVALGTLHASSFEVSLITAAQYAAWLLIGLPAGVIVQRLPLRGTQVVLDLLRAAAVLSVPAAAALGVLHMAHLVLVALVVGLATVVFDVGNATLLPSLVGKDELTRRNSLTSAANAATELGGPSLGGALVQLVGAASALLVDTASYLVSAILLWALPRPVDEPSRKKGAPPLELIKDGWRFVVRHPLIRSCVAAATLVNFTCGVLMAVTPVFLVRTLHLPAGLVGVLMASGGAGSLLGAAVTPRLGERLGSARAVVGASLILPLFLLLLPMSASWWAIPLFVLGNAGFAAGTVVISILTRTHRQSVTPPDLLPRVMATVRFVSWGAIPLGALTAGLTASASSPRTGLSLCAVVAMLVPLTLLSGPACRRRDLT
jgi:MFS family permease